jgi:DNA repair exonuclease SbcCD ATPase subunit
VRDKMRFWKRETKLETLEKELADLNLQIQELQQELKELRGETTPLNPVLLRFLKRVGFDYMAEKETLDRQVRQIEWHLKELEREKVKLESQISEEAFREEFKRRGIRFVGRDVEGFDFTIVKLKCPGCGHKFHRYLADHGSFNNVWNCTTQIALQQVYAMKFNRIWPLQCPRCGRELDVWVTREKL